MFMRKKDAWVLVALLFSIALLPHAIGAADAGSGLGHAATPSDISAWDDEVSPSGNLPPGSGSVAQGQQVYASQCAACHGDKGQGGPMDKLVGGVGSLDTKAPVKTIGSYWPYATTIFDYVRRAMPFTAPGTLSNDQVYAVTAYLLYMNGIVPQSAVMNGKSLASVRMPNHDNFLQKDPRPDAP
jgi:S-disulfanyl-L-cysteine oxidoreductase SoxD